MTASPLQFPSHFAPRHDYFHRAMDEINRSRVDDGLTPARYSDLAHEDRRRVMARTRQLKGVGTMGTSPNVNPIETTEYSSAVMLNKFEEKLLVLITIDRQPPHRVHLRIVADELKELRQMPEETRAEIVEVLDRLMDDFRRRILK